MEVDEIEMRICEAGYDELRIKNFDSSSGSKVEWSQVG